MASSAVVGVLRALLTLDSAEFDKGVRKAQTSLAGFEKSTRKLGAQATHLGSQLTKTITLPIVALGVTAAKAAIDFESSFAGIRKTVNATEAEFTGLAVGMRDLSKEIPINVNELNKIGEAAGQLGIKTDNILGFTKVMAQLGVTTNLSSDQAATSLARLANITGMPQTEFDRLGSTLVALGNDFATTESEIVDFGLRIAGAGEIAGLTESQILAIGAAMSSVGVEAEAGGTAVQKVLNGMTEAVATGNEQLARFAATAGMSSAEFAKAFREDAAGAFAQFVGGLEMQGDQAFVTLDKLGLGNERVIRAFLSLANAGDLLTRTLDTAADGWRENSALTEEARRRFETTQSQLTLLWNRLKDVGITFGNALLPSIQAAIKAFDSVLPLLESMVRTFTALPTPIQATALGLAAVAAAAGPAIFVLGQLLIASSAVAGAFTAKGIAARGAATGVTILTASLKGLIGPLGLIVAPLAAAAWGFNRLLSLSPAEIKKWSEAGAFAVGELGVAIQDTGAKTAVGSTYVEDYASQLDALNKHLEKVPPSASAAGGGIRTLSELTKEQAKEVERAAEWWRTLQEDQFEAIRAGAEAAKKRADELIEADRRANEFMLEDQREMEAQRIAQADEAAQLYLQRELEEYKHLEDAAAQHWRTISQINNELGLAQMARDAGVSVDALVPKLQTWDLHLKDLGASFAQLAQIAGDGLSGIVRGIGSVISSFSLASDGLKSFNSGWKSLTSGGGFSSIMSGLTSITSGIGAIIPLAQMAWKWMSKLFGGGEEGTQVNPARDEFLSKFAAEDQLRDPSNPAGFHGLAAKLTAITGESGGGALFRALINADTMEEFNAAVRNIDVKIDSVTSTAVDGFRGVGDTVTDAAMRGKHAFQNLTDDTLLMKTAIASPITVPVSFAIAGFRGGAGDPFSPSLFKTFDDWQANFLERNPGDTHRVEAALGDHKFHQGGVIGPLLKAHAGMVLGRDEVPVIAQTGEGILSRRGMAAFDAMNRGYAVAQGDDATEQAIYVLCGKVEELIRETREAPNRTAAAVLARVA